MDALTFELSQADWNRLVIAAHRITHNRQDAEDAVQEACLRVWRTGKWRRRAALTTYLHRAAVNAAINMVIAAHTLKRGGGFLHVDLPDLPSTADPCKAAQYWRKLECLML